MEYNPYAKEYKYLEKKSQDIDSDKKKLSEELNWFSNTNISDLQYSLKSKEEDKNNIQITINNFNKEITLLKIELDEIQKEIKSVFNPKYWFSKEQKENKNIFLELNNELEVKNENKSKREKSLLELNEIINQYKKNINRYKYFNEKEINHKISLLSQELSVLKIQIKQLYNLKINVDKKLEPIVSQIENYQNNISRIKSQLNKAKSFEDELDNAENSYEKAMIHQECEESMGESRPKKVIIESQKELRKLERDLKKAEDRAIQTAEKASREILKIVIDGNNMCYEGNTFIGISPLIKVTSELQKSYEVIIIFDSAIRSQLNMNDEKISNRFDDNVKTHIVASKQLADETILDISSEDKFCYVVSNDRFGEYRDKEIVINNRLIRHEIVDSRVIIHDLDINERY